MHHEAFDKLCVVYTLIQSADVKQSAEALQSCLHWQSHEALLHKRPCAEMLATTVQKLHPDSRSWME